MTAQAMEQEISSFHIVREIDINASIDIAFEAVLAEIGPEGQMLDGKPFPLTLEPWPGGRWFRDLSNNCGHLWGHVQVIKPPTLLELTGPMPMSYPAVNHVQYRLKADGNRTHVTLTHRAMGLIIEEHRDGMPEGWEHSLKLVKQIAERNAAKNQRGAQS